MPNVRADSNYGKWSDDDRDGEDTRQEVLIAESWVPVAKDSKGKVDKGLWVGPYAGFVTRDSEDLDIDHMVPLCEAGALALMRGRRRGGSSSRIRSPRTTT